jgi:hypothetical protein
MCCLGAGPPGRSQPCGSAAGARFGARSGRGALHVPCLCGTYPGYTFVLLFMCITIILSFQSHPCHIDVLKVIYRGLASARTLTRQV